MPKNENGEKVCVNHPTQILQQEVIVGLRKMEESNSELKFTDGAYPVGLLRCPECGYIEIYGIVKLD